MIRKGLRVSELTSWEGDRGVFLTHPHLSEAPLAQLDLQPQRLPRDLPRILGQALGLRLGCGTHGREAVTQAISMFWRGRQGMGLRQGHTASWLPGPVCVALCGMYTLALGPGGGHPPVEPYSPGVCGTGHLLQSLFRSVTRQI